MIEIHLPVDWETSRSGGAIVPDLHLLDWSRAWVDSGGSIFGPGPYFHVPFCDKEDGWEDDPEDDTSGRIACKWNVGDLITLRRKLKVKVIERLAIKCTDSPNGWLWVLRCEPWAGTK
jgi:hypothetical protein